MYDNSPRMRKSPQSTLSSPIVKNEVEESTQGLFLHIEEALFPNSTRRSAEASLQSSETSDVPRPIQVQLPRLRPKIVHGDQPTISLTSSNHNDDRLEIFCSPQGSLVGAPSTVGCYPWMEESGDVYRMEHESQIYQDTMRNMPLKDQIIALEMIRWVTYAARPLHIQELLEAIRLQMSIRLSKSDMDRTCGGYLTITEIGTVYLVSSGVKHLLESQNEDAATKGRGPILISSHQMMAMICFQELEQDHLQTTSDMPADIFVPGANLNTILPGFFNYAWKHWRYHYAKAEHQSYFLSGMLHDRLRHDWQHGCGLFFSKIPRVWPAADITVRDSLQLGTTAFLNAALEEGVRSEMLELVKLELEMGANPNATDASGNTPMHFAAITGNLETVKILLKYAGKSNLMSKSGDTALSLAVAYRHIEVVNLLLCHTSTSTDAYHCSESSFSSQYATYQKMSLLVSCSSCTICGDRKIRCVLFRINKGNEDALEEDPIYISEEFKTQAKCRLAVKSEKSKCHLQAEVSKQVTSVQWFSGTTMYRALSIAAKGGVEDVLRLLVLAGNDLESLRQNIALSEIMSKLQIV